MLYSRNRQGLSLVGSLLDEPGLSRLGRLLMMFLIPIGLAACSDRGDEMTLGDAKKHKEIILPSGLEHFYKDWRFSPAIRKGDMVFVSGMVGFDADFVSVESDEETQYRAAFQALDKILKEAGASFDDVVDITTFHVPDSDRQLFAKVKNEFIREPYPAWTAVTVHSLAFDASVEVKIIAVVD